MKAEITNDHCIAWGDIQEHLALLHADDHADEFDPFLMRPADAIEVLDELFFPTQPKGESK